MDFKRTTFAIQDKKQRDLDDSENYPTLADLMQERSVDLGKAYELINGGKISKGIKKEINWESLTDEFIYDERGNRRDTTKRDLKPLMMNLEVA